MKPLCILGVLDTPRGHEIKEELINWFSNDYEIECVVHDGSQYEYPAIKRAFDVALSSDKPVLYIHTKGAFNTCPTPRSAYENSSIHRPKEAALEDWQQTVRKMWRDEFVGRKELYLNTLDMNKPMCVCPFTGGSRKSTWTNGFLFNKLAAQAAQPNIHPSTDRFLYEHIFINTPVEVKGLIYSDIRSTESLIKMKNKIWTYF